MRLEWQTPRGFDTILLLIGDQAEHDGALQTAAELARARDASLKVLELRSPPARWLLRLADRRARSARPVERLVLEHRRQELQAELAEVLGPRGALRVEITLTRAKLGDALARELRGFCPDLIVTAMPEDGRLGRQLRDLLRSSPVPVWTIGPQASPRRRRILAGVSTALSGRAEETRVLDHEVLEVARALAQREGAALEVVHAWLPYGEQLIRGRGARGEAEAAEHARLVGEDHRRALRETLGAVDLSSLPLRSHLVKGEADQVIVELARRRESDLIVLGSAGRDGVAGALIGNTAESIVARAPCSVLTVKASSAPALAVAPRPTRGPARAFEFTT